MNKQTAAWLARALLAGLTAFALLCAACALYFNMPVRRSNPDGATEYKYEPGFRYFRGIEGYGFGRTNNDGFNNLLDYTPGEKIDVLLMGSSHTEGFCVPQKDSAAALLNRLFGGEKYVYSIGMAAHTFPYCAEHLARALEVYAPADAVVIELASLRFDPASLDAALDGTLPDMRSHEGGLLAGLQRLPYLRLFYTKYVKGDNPAAVNAESAPEGDCEASLEALLRRLGETGRAHGVEVILAYTPTVLPNPDGSVSADERPGERERFLRLCGENGVVFLDLTERNLDAARAGALPFGFANTSPGAGHINRVGLRVFAEGVYAHLTGQEG